MKLTLKNEQKAIDFADSLVDYKNYPDAWEYIRMSKYQELEHIELLKKTYKKVKEILKEIRDG